MFISSAMAESVSIKNLVSGNSSLSQYFSQQFAALTPTKVAIALLMGLVVGLLVAFTYKKCYRGVLYSPNFSLTLIMLTLVTTPVVMCIKAISHFHRAFPYSSEGAAGYRLYVLGTDHGHSPWCRAVCGGCGGCSGHCGDPLCPDVCKIQRTGQLPSRCPL